MEAHESLTTPGHIPDSPNLTADLRQHTPAARDIGQVVALVKALEEENSERSKKNARISEKYNAERPFSTSRLQADGLSWKSNFTTKPLNTLVDKVVPRFVTAIRNMRYLTAAKLPDNIPGANEKTEAFRRGLTEACRSREGWDELITEIAHEDVLFGFCAVGWLDSRSWFPEFFRQDAFLVPQGTKHNAKTAPIVCFKKSYLLHDLFELIRDRDAAEKAGWNVDEVIQSLNKATPEDRRSVESDPERLYADLYRESSVLTSFHGAKQVIVWHVFITEIDGNVTHVAFDAISKQKLFWRVKQFPSMADVAAFFSFAHGNGNLHSSKGIGRELYAMAGVLDRARNEVVDRLQLSGKLILQCEERQIPRFRMSVVGSAVLIAQGYNVTQAKVDGAVEPFFALDRFLTDLLDQVAGSTSPKVFEGERVTKAAVELFAAREEERRDAIIERFLAHFARMMNTIQARLCREHTTDPIAMQFQQKMLAIMSREELNMLANQPAVSAVQDYSERERQQIALIAQEARGNPLYNQYELEKRQLTAKVNAEFAEAVLLPQNDPTEVAENERQQKLELLLLQNGHEVPVSPRDNHIVHMEVVRQVVGGMLEAVADNPQLTPVLAAMGAHVQAHLQAAEAAGMAPRLGEFRQWLAQLNSTLTQLVQIEQEAAEMPPETPPVAV